MAATIAMLMRVGPPSQWSGAAAGILGKQRRRELTALWRSLPPERRAAVTLQFRRNMRKSASYLGEAAEIFGKAHSTYGGLPPEYREDVETRASRVPVAKQYLDSRRKLNARTSDFIRKYAAASRGVAFSREKQRALRRANTHLGSGSPDWAGFLENAKRKSFVSALSQDPRADEILIRHADQMNRLQTGKVLAQVRGRGSGTGSGSYEIRRLRGGGIGCTCPDWRYRGSVAPVGEQDCRHIQRWRAEHAASGDSVKTAEGFNSLRRKMEPGDIIVTGTAGSPTTMPLPEYVLDKAYDLGSGILQGPYTHAAIYTGKDKVVEAWLGRKTQALSTTRALRGKDFTVLRPKNTTKRQRERAARVAKRVMTTKRYALSDVAGAVAQLTGGPVAARALDRIIPGRAFVKEKAGIQCAGAVAGSYHAAGVDLVPGTPWRFVAPATLARSKRMRVIGRTRDMAPTR